MKWSLTKHNGRRATHASSAVHDHIAVIFGEHAVDLIGGRFEKGANLNVETVTDGILEGHNRGLVSGQLEGGHLLGHIHHALDVELLEILHRETAQASDVELLSKGREVAEWRREQKTNAGREALRGENGSALFREKKGKSLV